MCKSLLPVLCALSACGTLFAATPIFQERFNDSGTVEYLNGAEAGPGLTTQPGDKAYAARVETPDPTQPQPGATVDDVSALNGDLSQFTVTLWYKANREIQDPDSLIHIGGFYLLWDRVRGLTMRLGLPLGGEDFSNWFSPSIKGPVLPFNAVDEWIFYAITWNYDTRSCIIYQGTASAPAEIASEKHSFAVTGRVLGSTASIIGNHVDGHGNVIGHRAFSGQIDNIRIYDTVLDLDAIDVIRKADLANSDPKLP
jgi:hypothetical protein